MSRADEGTIGASSDGGIDLASARANGVWAPLIVGHARGDDLIMNCSVRRATIPARKKGNIVGNAEELDAMLARGESETDWARVMAKTGEELAADMASDPAWDGVPEDGSPRA